MTFHPHTHCIVQGAGPSVEGDRWVQADPDFFIAVRVLSTFFKKAFTRCLDHAYQQSVLKLEGELEEFQHPAAFQAFLDGLRNRDWIKYLARYTHRVAISNNRLLRMEDEDVLFRYKDYRRGGQWCTEQTHATEFIRRSPEGGQWGGAASRPAFPLRLHPLLRPIGQSQSAEQPQRVPKAPGAQATRASRRCGEFRGAIRRLSCL